MAEGFNRTITRTDAEFSPVLNNIMDTYKRAMQDLGNVPKVVALPKQTL